MSAPPSEKSLQHQVAAYHSWTKTEDWSARTSNGRTAFEQKFLDDAGGDPKRAASARRPAQAPRPPQGRCGVKRRNLGATARATSTTPIAETKPTNAAGECASSQQVSWWVSRVCGSSAGAGGVVADDRHRRWQQLDDHDPVKIAALFDGAQHWALRLESCQRARCDASREISDAVDWSALTREINQRADFSPRGRG